MGSYKPEPYGMIDTLPNSVLQETRLSQVSLERRFIGWGVPQLVMFPGTAECSAWFVSSLSHPESPAPTELWKTKHNRSCALMSPHCFRPLPPNHRSLHGYTHVNPPGLSRLCCFTEADKRGSEGTWCVCVCVFQEGGREVGEGCETRCSFMKKGTRRDDGWRERWGGATGTYWKQSKEG